MPDILIHTVDVANATISIRRAGSITPSGVKEEAAGPSEFSVMQDCYAQDGIIRPRRRLVRPTGQYSCRKILSMGEFKNGETRDTWLLTSWLRTSGGRQVEPTAELLLRSLNVMSIAISHQGHETYPAGVPFAFWTYRNQLWASNGLRSQTFDGRDWSDLNGGRDLTTGIAARLGGVAEGKMFLANTPTYPDEYTWADALLEVPVNTKWSGVAPGGGTGVGTPLYEVAAPDAQHGLFAGGGYGTIIRSLTQGLSWFSLDPPTVFSIRALALVASGGVVKGLMAGVTGGDPRQGNCWWCDDFLSDNPTWIDQTRSSPQVPTPMFSITDVYAAKVDPSFSGTLVVIGGQRPGDRAPELSYRDNSGVWVYANRPEGSIGAVIRALLFTPGSERNFACGTRADNGDTLFWQSSVGNPGSWSLATPKPVATGADFLTMAGSYVTGDCIYIGGNVGAVGKVWRLEYDGDSWTECAALAHVPLDLLAFEVTGRHSTIYAVGERGMIVKSTNSGGSWDEQKSGVPVQLSRIINYDPDDHLKLCVVGDGGVFLSTIDGGETWIQTGVGENTPNKLTNSNRFGAGESIRAYYQRSGMLTFFTNRGIRVLESANMKRQFELDGFETFNNNCIGEFRNMIVILGKMNGTPGIYGWDGSASPPRLLSEAVTGLFRPSPGNHYIPCLWCIPDTSDHIYDTEDDFRPRLTNESPGWAFNEAYWSYKNGLMTMRVLPKATPETTTTVLSHGNGTGQNEPAEDDNSGIYVPNVSDWGYISFDYTLNHSADDNRVSIKLWIRTAPDEAIPGTPGTWTKWEKVHPLSYTGQDILFGRCTLRLDEKKAPPINKWLQFKLICRNSADSDFNVIINRVIVRAYTDTDDETLVAAPAPPSLVVHDDHIYAHFSLDTVTGTPRYQPRCVVLSGEKLQASTIDTGLMVSCGLVSNDELFLGLVGKENYGIPCLVFMPEDSVVIMPQIAEAPVTQRLRFFVDFSGADARARTLPKDLTKVYVSARPIEYNPMFTMSLRWASDDISKLPATGTSLDFSDVHKPESGLLRHHTLDVGASSLSANSSGRRFHVVISGSSEFILEALSLEALVRPANWPTAYGGA